MSLFLLLIINFSGSIGPFFGYYAPTLDSLNRWLYSSGERQLRTTSVIIGGAGRVDILPYLSLEASAEYYKGRSHDRARSLFLVPVDVRLTYKYIIFPVYVYSYMGVGGGLCLTEYEDRGVKKRGMGIGPVAKIGLEFLPTPRFGVEVSLGWRFINVTDIEIVDLDTGNNIPLLIELSGGYLKVTFERVFR